MMEIYSERSINAGRFLFFDSYAQPLKACLMIANGCDPKTVQFHAGHANAATTLNTYSKVIRENVIAKEREHDKYIFELDECSG